MSNNPLTRALPATAPREKAEMLTKRLMGLYPFLTAHDPKTYAAAMVEVLMKYPPSIGEQAIMKAAKASPDRLPSVPGLMVACEDLFADTRDAITYAQQWDLRSKQQLQERDEIKQTKEGTEESRRQAVERILGRVVDAKRQR
jgi:hypothetical protein